MSSLLVSGLLLAALAQPSPQVVSTQSIGAAAGPSITSGPSQPNGVAAGEVGPTSAVLWARPAFAGPAHFAVALESNPSQVLHSFSVAAKGGFNPIKRRVGPLTPGTRYVYRVTDSTGVTVEGRFRTPHLSGQAHGLRFGVSGDSRGELKPYFSVANVPSRDLEFFMMLGDTIYADVQSPEVAGVSQALSSREYSAKHNEVLSGPVGQNFVADLRGSTALLAVIDDHEVTNDFAGGAAPSSNPLFGLLGNFINETPLFQMGMAAFQAFHPIANQSYGDTGDARTAFKTKLYRTRTYGRDAAVFVLDARSFRDQELPDANPTDPTSVGAFLVQSFDPSRTMLGQVQVQDLLADLSAAQAAGVVWKFVFVPEPIQNLGLAAAGDRFEGYAAERTLLLDFIKTQGIQNVVFVAADIHGTLVNNLSYQLGPFLPQIPVDSFEISTGAIAYDAPFGPTVIGLASLLGLLSPQEVAFYNSLPLPFKDGFIETLVNANIAPLGYDALGLAGSSIDATLVAGSYTVTHTWGWTEFEIDATTSQLLITTYGLEPFTQGPPTPRQVIRIDPK